MLDRFSLLVREAVLRHEGRVIKQIGDELMLAFPRAPAGLACGLEVVARAADTDLPARLRELCLGLPETTERLSHGEPTWFVRGKRTFVTYADHHHDDRLAFWCAAPVGEQEALVASDPDRFFVPPYVGHRG